MIIRSGLLLAALALFNSQCSFYISQWEYLFVGSFNIAQFHALFVLITNKVYAHTKKGVSLFVNT